VGLIYWKVVVQDYNLSTASWDTIGEFESFYDPIVKMNVGDTRDSFSFSLDNTYGMYNDFFKTNQRVIISRKSDFNSGWNDDHVLMNGIVRSVPFERSASSNRLTVEGTNFSDIITRSLVFVDGNNRPINEFLRFSLNSVNQNNPRYRVEWDETNPVFRSDGSNFPPVAERVFYKNMGYILDKYSGNEMTGDGHYFWFVTIDNKLRWLRRSISASSQSFDEVLDSFISLKRTIDVNDVINFVVVKGGFDPKGRPIQNVYADYVSISKHGFKYYILIDETKSAQSSLESDRVRAGVDDMSSASYPFVPSWNNLVTTTNFNDYSDKFRDFFKETMSFIGKSYVDFRKNGKLGVDISVDSDSKLWGLGSLVSHNISSLNSGVSKLLRLENVTYGHTVDIYSFKEDIGTL